MQSVLWPTRDVYKLAFWVARSRSVYAKWSIIGRLFLFLFLSNLELQFEFRGIAAAHTLAQLYLPLLCQLALQHYT